ncbi:Gypsy retrotransposon integrase-like protein 1, partial [Mucuna pruriens]
MCPGIRMNGLTYWQNWPLSTPTIDRPEVWYLSEGSTWVTPFIEYLKEDQLPNDPDEARRVAKETPKYTLVGQQLYRRGFAFPLLRCLEGDEAAYVIKEVHEGVCETHIGGRALASKIARAGYYWPTLRHDCMEYVKKYDKCQRFAEGHKVPSEHLHSITSPWPFYRWGVDILGPFPMAPGQLKFLIVAVDYFTKWIETEPIVAISCERFGIPAEIILDNGTQFASRTTTEFCEGLKIKQLLTSVEHPQTNGQAEMTNKVILRGLHKHLEEARVYGWTSYPRYFGRITPRPTLLLMKPLSA